MTSFHIVTYGLPHHLAESERMAGLLQQAHFDLALSLEHADIVIFNACQIKGLSPEELQEKVSELQKNFPYKIIIIAGCLAQKDKFRKFPLMGRGQLQNVVEVVEERLHNNIIQLTEVGSLPLDLPKIRLNPVIEVIPIQRSSLTCFDWTLSKDRKKLQSYTPAEIVAVAKEAISSGAKEITLTGLDTFAYGLDINTNLAGLLQKLLQIPGQFKIKIDRGSLQYLLLIKDALFALMKHENVFKYLYIPMISGSNKVLKELEVGQSKEQFLEVIKELKEQIPEMNLETDLVIGTPWEEEEEEDHWQTLQLLREIQPDIIHLAQFTSLSKNSAAKLPFDQETVERRLRIMVDITNNITRLQNERWNGWEGEVIIDESCSDFFIGHNLAYKPINLKGNYQLGDSVKIKVKNNILVGEPI